MFVVENLLNLIVKLKDVNLKT